MVAHVYNVAQRGGHIFNVRSVSPAPDSSVVAVRGDTDAESGQSLLDAYTAAKSLTPGGNALAASNRACVLVPPGRWALPATLSFAEFVDVIALAPGNPPGTVVTSTLNTGTAYRHWDIWDVVLRGFTIENTGNAAGCHGLWWRDDHPALTLAVYRNMHFRQPNAATDKCPVVSPTGIVGGKWYDCEADDFAWRSPGTGEGIYGEWYRCVGGTDCFNATNPGSEINSIFEDVTVSGNAFSAGNALKVPVEGTFRRVTCRSLTTMIYVKDASFRDCVFQNVTAGNILFRLSSVNGASWINCDLLTETGAGEVSIDGWAPNEEIVVAHCRMNVAMVGIVNLIGTHYNVVDAELAL